MFMLRDANLHLKEVVNKLPKPMLLFDNIYVRLAVLKCFFCLVLWPCKYIGRSAIEQSLMVAQISSCT